MNLSLFRIFLNFLWFGDFWVFKFCFLKISKFFNFKFRLWQAFSRHKASNT